MSKNISTLLFVGILTLGCIGGEAVYAEEVEPAGDAATVSETTEAAPEAANGLGAVDEAGIAPMAEDASQPTTGGVTSDPAEARDAATYDAALKSIENLNKKEALKAGIDAVDAQVKGFDTWKYIPNGINQIQGQVQSFMLDTVIEAWDWTGSTGPALKSQLYALLNNIDIDSNGLTTEQATAVDATTFKALIDQGLADARYNTDTHANAEFKSFVDGCASTYSTGRTTLEQTIPKFDATYTEYSLKSKTDAQLIQIAQALPETTLFESKPSYTGEFKVGSLYNVYVYSRKLAQYGDDGEVATIDERYATQYAFLVTAATRIDPEFKVDLSGVTSLVVKEETKAPNSGSLFSDGDNSATIVTVALGAVAGLAGAAGLAYVIKRYLFSPLKRRH